jgi:hypothetical protein
MPAAAARKPVVLNGIGAGRVADFSLTSVIVAISVSFSYAVLAASSSRKRPWAWRAVNASPFFRFASISQ